MSYHKVFLSFADSRMRRAAARIKAQALAVGVYDDVMVFDEKDLDESFARKFHKQLRLGSRGFGYWCWKPQALLQCLDGIKDGDILNYNDAGCHINAAGGARLLEFFEIANRSSSGMLGFELSGLPESHYTKGDLLDHFGVRENPAVTQTGQIMATVLFIKKSTQTMEMVRQWLGVYEYDFSLADDTPSRSPNLPGFIAHRHDQSIFSIIRKLHPIELLSANSVHLGAGMFPAPDTPPEQYPILVLRDRGVRKGVLAALVRAVSCLIPLRKYRRRARNRMLYW